MEARPDLQAELLELAPLNSRTLLFVCGPKGQSISNYNTAPPFFKWRQNMDL